MRSLIKKSAAAYARLQKASLYERLITAAVLCTCATALLLGLRENTIPLVSNVLQLLWVLPGTLVFLSTNFFRSLTEIASASRLERVSLLLATPLYAEPFRISIQCIGLETLAVLPLLARAFGVAVLYFLLQLFLRRSRNAALVSALEALLSCMLFAFAQSMLPVIFARLFSNALLFPNFLQSRRQTIILSLQRAGRGILKRK